MWKLMITKKHKWVRAVKSKPNTLQHFIEGWIHLLCLMFYCIPTLFFLIFKSLDFMTRKVSLKFKLFCASLCQKNSWIGWACANFTRYRANMVTVMIILKGMWRCSKFRISIAVTPTILEMTTVRRTDFRFTMFLAESSFSDLWLYRKQ